MLRSAQISPAKTGAAHIACDEGAAQENLVGATQENRLQEISEIQQWIEREREKRLILSKK